jgi:hypothetical protein
MAASSGMWYSKVSKKATRKTLRLWRGKGLRCLFREYLSYTMGVGVVRGESAVGVPLRRLFRYEWMDVSRFMMPYCALHSFVLVPCAVQHRGRCVPARPRDACAL